MRFTQITALVALLSASAMGVALPADGGDAPKGQAPHTGTDTGHNNCGGSTIDPLTGNGPKLDKNDCLALKADVAKLDKSFRIRGPRLIGFHGTCQFTATVNRPEQAWLGGNDVTDLIQSSLDQWQKNPILEHGSAGTIQTGTGGEVPCDNVKGNAPVTVYWTLSYHHK